MPTHTILDRQAFDHWQFEYQLVNALFARLERVERAILTALGCPVDPASIDDILTGKQQPPWKKRTAKRDRERALHAMHALVRLAAARGHIAFGEENSRLAAHEALLAGLHANDAAANAVISAQISEGRRAGGRRRGEQKSKAATRHDKDVKRYVEQWYISDRLQDEYRSPTAYVHAKTRLARRTIQRTIKLLGLRRPRQ